MFRVTGTSVAKVIRYMSRYVRYLNYVEVSHNVHLRSQSRGIYTILQLTL